MTAESNHAIVTVLVLGCFLIGSKNGELLLEVKECIAVGLKSKSSCLVKPRIVLVLVCVTTSCFQSEEGVRRMENKLLQKDKKLALFHGEFLEQDIFRLTSEVSHY